MVKARVLSREPNRRLPNLWDNGGVMAALVGQVIDVYEGDSDWEWKSRRDDSHSNYWSWHESDLEFIDAIDPTIVTKGDSIYVSQLDMDAVVDTQAQWTIQAEQGVSKLEALVQMGKSAGVYQCFLCQRAGLGIPGGGCDNCLLWPGSDFGEFGCSQKGECYQDWFDETRSNNYSSALAKSAAWLMVAKCDKWIESHEVKTTVNLHVPEVGDIYVGSVGEYIVHATCCPGGTISSYELVNLHYGTSYAELHDTIIDAFGCDKVLFKFAGRAIDLIPSFNKEN